MKVQQVKIKEFKALKDINVEVNGHHLLVMGDDIVTGKQIGRAHV